MDQARTRRIHAACVRKIARHLCVSEIALNSQVYATMSHEGVPMHTALKALRDWHLRQLRFR